MQFVWLNKQGVASDAGFVVQSMERHVFEYREASHVIRLDGESAYAGLDDAAWGFVFYRAWHNMSWQIPFKHEPIAFADRERIKANIETAFTFMGGIAIFE